MESADTFSERRFSASRFTDQPKGFPVGDFQIDPVDRFELGLGAQKDPSFDREVFLKPRYLEEGGRFVVFLGHGCWFPFPEAVGMVSTRTTG